ncbi:MAG: TrkA family potassium uptake protein [Planctomycetia bacterium]|jgi:trk system potassium uptake protein TrkA|nr:TrkA family potassium uptake protein [Planctomycetia bacterium]
MAPTKKFIMLGMGTFGTALTRKLAANGCQVTGVDQRRERLDVVKHVVHEAVIGDSTDRQVLENLAIRDATAVFISLGENISTSLLATLHVKELGARNVIVKGVTLEHGKILEHVGADRVVFPEEEVARELADRMTWPNVLDYLPIDPDYSVAEVAMPGSLSGRTLADANLRSRIGVHVMGIKDVMRGKFEMFPDGKTMLLEDQVLLVVGREKELAALREMA